MLKISRLYSIPEVFDPIEFTEGLNLILGEKDNTSDKTNGVGKSLSIEFINFALLKKKSESRVALIPKEVFPINTKVCLDFEINNVQFTIQRSLAESESPNLIEAGRKVDFTKIEDAANYLTEKLFSKSDNNYPSFRIMLGPLIRDEKSEFKSLINCYDTKLRIPENYSPHLYLLGIDIELYDLVKTYIKEIEDIDADIKRIKENVFLIRQKNIDDARSDLNELDNEVHSIEGSIDKLQNVTGYELVRDELQKIESQIEELRRSKAILKQQLSKLRSVSQKIDIDPSEIAEFYEQLKAGLGILISKNIEEVIHFKAKIDEFQNTLITERRNTVLKDISDLDKQLKTLDEQYTKGLSVLNQKGELKNLKQTYAAFKEKSDQLSQLRSFVDRFDKLEIDKQTAKSQKEAGLLKIQSEIIAQKKNLENFEKTILSIHEFIQGNKQASFQIKNSKNKQVIDITMRIDSDGSHSVDREKVFIYDIALLLNEFTQLRHPGFLIHDNIFDVDQDTLIKSLQYLEGADFGSMQYILTLNSDRLESAPAEIKNSIKGYTRASFTKSNRFIKTKYQETQKS